MANWFESGAESSGFAQMVDRFCQMLDDGQRVFDLSSKALIGSADPEGVREELYAVEARIDEEEQRLRRQILVHCTVHGAAAAPSMLVLMSLTRDAERIGDFAKNIFELALLQPRFAADELEDLRELQARVTELLGRVREVYAGQDLGRARAILQEDSDIEDVCDAHLARAAASSENAVGFALASRYFKRVASHANNVATSLLMPLDKLDVFDES